MKHALQAILRGTLLETHLATVATVQLAIWSMSFRRIPATIDRAYRCDAYGFVSPVRFGWPLASRPSSRIERSAGITRRADTLILLSGGVDSATALALSVEEGAAVDTLFVDYGQAGAVAEAKAAASVAAFFNVPHRAMTFDGIRFGSGEIRGRNAFLLHVALMAFRGDTGVVTLGIHAGTPYRDCSPGFVAAMRVSYEFLTDGRVGIVAPFIDSLKSDVVQLAKRTGVPIALTYSCEASNVPCLVCSSCRDRGVLIASSQ